MPGNAVTLSVGTGSGSATAVQSVTGSDGIVSVRWTLGERAGTQTLTARAGNVTTMKSIAAVADAPARMAASGPSDFLRVGGAAIAVAIDVFDRFENPVSGQAVAFVASGGGTIQDNKPTDAAGRATATWVLGSIVGTSQQVEARVLTLPPVAFRATTVSVTLSIASPAEGDRFLSTDSIGFSVTASLPAGISTDSIRWTSSISGAIGRGPSPAISGLAAGTHTITVSALGASKAMTVRVVGDLLALYRTAPSASEIARIQRDFDIQYIDGPIADEAWTPYSYAFDQTSLAPSRIVIIAKLDVMRRQRFSEPLPFTGGRSVYDWMRASVSRLNLRLDCAFNSGGGGVINLNLLVSVWDSRRSDKCKEPFSPIAPLAPYDSPIQLFVHEVRHSEAGDPGHTTCANGIPGDAQLEGGSGFATGALYAMWVYKYSLYDPASIRSDARQLARVLLERICSAPTHSDPKVRALIAEVLAP